MLESALLVLESDRFGAWIGLAHCVNRWCVNRVVPESAVPESRVLESAVLESWLVRESCFFVRPRLPRDHESPLGQK